MWVNIPLSLAKVCILHQAKSQFQTQENSVCICKYCIHYPPALGPSSFALFLTSSLLFLMLPSTSPEGNAEATGPSGPASSAHADSALRHRLSVAIGQGLSPFHEEVEYVSVATSVGSQSSLTERLLMLPIPHTNSPQSPDPSRREATGSVGRNKGDL